MKKRWRIEVFAILMITVLLAGAGVSYATMTQVVNIEGYASMGSVSWDVHFEDLSKVTILGNATEEVAPTINSNSTTISAYKVKFYQNGDGVIYKFNIVNDGSMDAVITSLIKTKPTCTGTNNEDAELVCNNLEYTLTYSDGTVLKEGDVLNRETSKGIQLKLQYVGSELPNSEVSIGNLAISIIYSQY